jgi:glycosyltransferase involved in cell wall biosynthesis
MKDSVSVIIPTFNRCHMLPRAIDSVLNQTYDNLELIIVDDGSDDSTADLVRGYLKKSSRRILYLQQDNSGPAAARNRGINAASSDYLAFLDSDDWFHRDKIRLQVAVIRQSPATAISHTGEIWYRRGRILNQKHRHRKESGFLFDRCLELCAIGMSTVMLHRSIISRVGLFDEQLPCCEDYDYWLRAATHLPFILLDRPLTLKEGGRADQLSCIYRTGMDRYRIRAIVKILESGMLTPEQYRTAVKALAKKCRIYGSGCLKHGRIAEGKFYLALPEQFAMEPVP